MKYVPGLIPERYRVEIKNPGEQHVQSHKHGLLYWLSLLSGILILGVSLFYITRPYVAIPLMLAGLSIFPFSYRYIENLLVFKFTPLLKTIFILIVVVISFQLAYFSASQQRAGTEHLRIQKEKEAMKKKREDDFVNTYPFITRQSYNKWLENARDSVTDPNLKRNSFVEKERQQRRERDSIWAEEHKGKY